MALGDTQRTKYAEVPNCLHPAGLHPPGADLQIQHGCPLRCPRGRAEQVRKSVCLHPVGSPQQIHVVGANVVSLRLPPSLNDSPLFLWRPQPLSLQL